MSAENSSDGRSKPQGQGTSVLANLPRTRPQRSSARRAAARKAAGAAVATELVAAPPAKRAAGRTSAGAPGASRRAKPKAARAAAPKQRSASAARRSARAAAAEPVPPQGFECEGEGARGPVQPPGSTELVTSAVEIMGELAKSGLATGERLLKDVFSRLSPS
jgi:hypothetical protein